MRKTIKEPLFISVAFFVMTLCVFGPLELYITNQSELWFSFFDVLKIAGIMSGVAVVVLGGIGLLLKGKIRSAYAAVLFVITLCLYIQGNFLNISYGVLDGKTIDWSAYTGYAVINSILWIVCIVILLLLFWKKPEIFVGVSRTAALFIVAVQVVTLGILISNNNVLAADESEAQRMSTDNIMAAGSKNNIVIFVLDTFDDPLMDALMETEGEHYRSVFADFTRFTDCAASGATTAAAMPIIVSGQYYTDGLGYGEYVNQAFDTDGLYSALNEQDYSVNLYTNSRYVGTGADGLVDNYVKGEGGVSSYVGLTSKYSTFTLFKYMPHVLKPFFWLYTAEFNAYQPGSTYVTDDVAFYETLSKEGLYVDGENSYHLFHLQGPHYPYTMDEFAQPDGEATREQQAMGNLYIVEEYIEQMKALGIYEDAMIIVTADHGDAANYAAPILFVKDRGTRDAFVENDAPVSHIDLHATLFSYLGADTGASFFEIPEEQPRERLFYVRIQNAGSFYMEEYLIKDKVALVGCGERTGYKPTPATERKNVVMGEKMTLGLDGTANPYVVSGMDSWPIDCVETIGTESKFLFLLDKIPDDQLEMEIEVARIYNEAVDQSVTIFVNGQQCHEEKIEGAQTIRFSIPVEMITGTELAVKLEYATKWCSLFLSGVTIGTADTAAVVEEDTGFSITKLLSIPLNALMNVCYGLLNNYILAILVFTLLTKIILLPLSFWLQRNSIKMVELMPELNELKIKYFGDKETIAEETQALYKRRGYQPLASTIPMIIQIVMLMGVIETVKQLLANDPDNMLLLVPSQAGGVTFLMPLAAGLAALMLTLAQNKLAPLQKEQEKAEKISTGAVSVGISLFLGGFVSLGTGVYWIASNLFSILVQCVSNAVIDPKKYIDYEALEKSRKELEAMSALGTEISKEDREREKVDYKRFFSVANKHLVFYSEKSGFYKYFQNTIEFLLANSNVIIHYVTNDPKDQIFALAEKEARIRPYYIGPKKIITLFMKMDADVVVMTTPDLESYFLKRSYVRKDIEYVYMFHGMTSTNMVVRKGAYDHFDTIFCVGQHQVDELRETEEMYNLPAKRLVPVGYGMFDNLLSAYAKMEQHDDGQFRVMIAPSWQEGNLLDACIEPMLKVLAEKGCKIILRPHPEYIKRFPGKMERLKGICNRYDANQLELQLDFSSNETIYTSNLLITDWSGIANEFAYTTKRPVLFIDTPVKVLNEEYVNYRNQPIDITLRNQMGKSIAPENIQHFAEVFDDVVHNRDAYEKEIEKIVEKYVFNIGTSGQAGAKYLLRQLIERDSQRK